MAKNRLRRVIRRGGVVALAAALCAGAIILYGARNGGANGIGAQSAVEAKPAVPVVTEPLALRDFESVVVVQGTIEAKHTAIVSAKIPGTIEAIYVDEGDAVVEGETRLFQTDALKLRKAVDIARQNLEIARYGRQEKEAYRERLQADFEKAKIDYDRHQLLYESNSIAIDVLEQNQSRYRQALAMCKHAQSLVDLAAEQERQAEASLAIAQKDLGDALVTATLTGKVTHRFLEPGEMAGAGTPVVRIEDTSLVEASAFLSSPYYADVRPGETIMRVTVHNTGVGEVPVIFKSPTINPKLRTFEVKCQIKDPPEGVVSGAMAHIAVLIAQHRGFGVPKGAIQTRDDRSVVFHVEGDTARMLSVTTGFESGGMVEVQGEGLREGLSVVTMGQFQVEEGSRVVVRRENR